MNLCILTIITPIALEEVIVDWLLEHETTVGFNSRLIRGHGTNEDHMSLSEKVTGRSGQIMFQIHMSLDNVHVILKNLKDDFMNSGLYYTVSPLIDAGDISSYDPV